MEIIINGQIAALKKGSSFDFIAENNLFTGSDSYTLAITFPLKDCPQNRQIFGHLERADVEKSHIVFDCDIHDRNFHRSGSITVTEISETEMKTQFLEGRNEQNFNTSFDDIYLNQLRLGYPSDRDPTHYEPQSAWATYPDNDSVPLPWVNNTSGNMQNEVTYDEQTQSYKWAHESRELTFQPFLLHILNKICEVVGYTGDFTEIENSGYKYLVICNTLPYTWGVHNFAMALPHWSLTEFFEQLELFLFGEFSIDHKARRISFAFSTSLIRRTEAVLFENVVNEYSVEVSREESSDYLGVKNLAYADNDNRFWAYRSCAWYIREHKAEAMVFDKLSELLEFAAPLKMSGYERSVTPRGGTREAYTRGYRNTSDGNKLFYAKDVDTFFIMFCYRSELIKTAKYDGVEYHWYQYYNRLEPINQFGSRMVDEEADDVEINIVPAWIDDTDDDHGRCLFLECGEMGSAVQWVEDTEEEEEETPSSEGGVTFGGARTGYGKDYDDKDYDGGALAQSKAGKTIERGEQDKADAYFDHIYVAFWDGNAIDEGLKPCPIIDRLTTDNDFQYTTSPYSLRLDHPTLQIDRRAILPIDGKKKYTFSFLADEIPDTHAVFHIRGGRYLCEKITARFTEHGMSKMMKGVFYRLKDE